MIINSPLKVPVGKKDFILNLNCYRNTHFRELNNAKINYKYIIKRQLMALTPFKSPVAIKYTLYPKTKRRTDIANVIAIHAKFFCDALVDHGLILDDDYHNVVHSSESFGHVDKDFPRVEIEITEIQEDK